MSRGDLIEFNGEVVTALGGGYYSIILDNKEKSVIRAKICGRLKQNHIRVIPGDKVQVGVSPYDVSHGIIQRRER